MEITDLPLFSMLKQRMTWLNQRQDLLSQNVANADTPKYISRDLKALDFDQMLSGSRSTGTSMMATNVRHFSLTPSRKCLVSPRAPNRKVNR